VTVDVEVLGNPFPGLRAFESSEAHLFFGRDGQSDEVLRRLEQARFLAVVGTSGSGKSSLVRAGLLPSLQSGYMASAGSRWRIALMRPGSDPVANLARALAGEEVLGRSWDVGTADAIPKLIETGLRRSSRGLVELTRQARFKSRENLLIIVDQFEEIFRFRRVSEPAEDHGVSNAAAAFVKLLLEAAEDKSVPVYVVLTMRSDFLGDCAQFRDLPEALNDGQYLVPRMSREQRREAIEGPIVVGGAAATPRLIQRLLNDLGDEPDQLPILQHALMRTWEKWKDRGQPQQPLDLPDYQAIGTMSDALSLHADEVYDKLPDGETRRVAAIVFKCLTEKGPDNREIRRPTKLEEIRSVAGAGSQTVEEVIERFRVEGVSFLMPPANVALTPDCVIDISHESLIRLWRRLHEWVEEESRSAATYLRLAQATALYHKGQASLWRHPELGLGLDWDNRQKPNQPWAQRYDSSLASALTFLEKSRRARTRRRVYGSAVTAFFFLMSVAFGLTNYQAVKQETRLKLQAESEAAGALQAAGTAQAAQQLAQQREKEAIARHLAAESAGQRRLDVFDPAFRERATLISALQEHPSIVALLTPGRREIVDAAFSPDGKILATLNADSSVVLWDVRTRRRVDVAWLGPQQDPTSMAFSPNGRLLAVGSRAGKVALWDVATGQVLGETLSAGADITSLAFTPDAALLVAGSEDGTVTLWRSTAWRQTPVVLRDGVGKVMSIAISSDGKLLACGGDGGTVTLWNLQTRKRLPKALEGHKGIVSAVAFSRDGTRLVSGGADHRLALWDVRTMQQTKTLSGHQDAVSSVAFGPAGALASGGADQTLILWDAGGKEVARLEGHQGDITRVSYSPDGQLIVTASTDGSAILWDVADEMRFGTVLQGRRFALSSAAFSPDGTLMVGGGRDDALTIWEAKTKQLLHREIKANQQWINAVAFSPDGRILATAGHDGTVRFWDPLAGTSMGPSLKAHALAVTSVAFSADGRFLATGSLDQSARIWDVATALPVGDPLRGHQDAVLSVAFSADGSTLASGSADATIVLWDVATCKPLGDPLRGHRQAVTSVAFNPRQNQLAAASDDETVTLWSTDERKQLGEPLFGHRGAVKALAFAPDGKMLASGGNDNAVMLWDVDARRAHGKPLRARSEAADEPSVKAGISGVAFSPDGKGLLAAGWNHAAVFWDVDLHSWLRQACVIANRNLTHGEWRQFVPDKAYRKTCERLPSPDGSG
jgi:WD40 repeat protein/energy-coupling factor transporter ATP-binding protein EcfA2